MTNDIDQLMARCPFEEARFATLGRPDPQVIFLVRERSAMIRYFGDTRLLLRGRLFVEDDCLLMAVLLRVGRHVRRIYPTWWDYSNTRQSAAFFAMLRQDLLAVHFYGDNGRRERSFVTENSVQDCFGHALELLKGFPSWSEERFEMLQRKTLANADSLESLWQEMD